MDTTLHRFKKKQKKQTAGALNKKAINFDVFLKKIVNSSHLPRFCVANKELNVSAAPAVLLICHSAALQVRVYALNLVLPPKGSH